MFRKELLRTVNALTIAREEDEDFQNIGNVPTVLYLLLLADWQKPQRQGCISGKGREGGGSSSAVSMPYLHCYERDCLVSCHILRDCFDTLSASWASVHLWIITPGHKGASKALV